LILPRLSTVTVEAFGLVFQVGDNTVPKVFVDYPVYKIDERFTSQEHEDHKSMLRTTSFYGQLADCLLPDNNFVRNTTLPLRPPFRQHPLAA
jgi:hypothetical protein